MDINAEKFAARVDREMTSLTDYLLVQIEEWNMQQIEDRRNGDLERAERCYVKVRAYEDALRVIEIAERGIEDGWSQVIEEANRR